MAIKMFKLINKQVDLNFGKAILEGKWVLPKPDPKNEHVMGINKNPQQYSKKWQNQILLIPSHRKTSKDLKNNIHTYSPCINRKGS